MTGKLCLMLDVDGVIVNGRPEDGLSWATDIANDLGVDPAGLQKAFFEPHWPDIVIGRKNLLDVLSVCLPALALFVRRQDLVDYWFKGDSALDDAALLECDQLRADGVSIFSGDKPGAYESEFSYGPSGSSRACGRNGLFSTNRRQKTRPPIF